MPEGKLLGEVILTCPTGRRFLKLPSGTSVEELLSKAAAVFGAGYIIDRDGNIVTSEDPKLAGGYYSLWPDGADEPDSLHFWPKGVGPRVQGCAPYVRPDANGGYNYLELAILAGYPRFMPPKCFILGDPAIMRIYPDENGMVFIDRTKLGDWGTKGKPVPLEGLGWWTTIKELVAPPAIAQQPPGVEVATEGCTAVRTH